MYPRSQETASKVCVIKADVRELATAEHPHEAEILSRCSQRICAWSSPNQNIPGICFAGASQAMVQAFAPDFRAQVRSVAAYLQQISALPPVEEMQVDIHRDVALTLRELLRSPANNYQIHGPAFIHTCGAELKRSPIRARNRRKEVPRASRTA